MVTCCANPACCAGYHDRMNGELCAVERAAGVEFFWLCGECARKYRLSIAPGGQVEVEFRVDAGYGRPFHAMSRACEEHAIGIAS
jgi:hypothetical protein